MHRSGISRGKIRMLGTSQQRPNSSAPPAVYSKILQGKSLEEHRLRGKEELKEQLKAMNPEAKQEFIRLQHLAADDDWEDMSMDVDPSTSVNIDAIMEGSERIELSHAGGELRQSIEEEMEEEIIVDRRWDWRTRRDRTDRLNQQFVAQMPEMLKAYMRWCESVETGRERSTSAEVWTITVVDMFDMGRYPHSGSALVRPYFEASRNGVAACDCCLRLLSSFSKCRRKGARSYRARKVQQESALFGLPNGLAPAPTGLFGLGLGFGCRSKPKPVCRLGKPVCSLSRETGLLVSQYEWIHYVHIVNSPPKHGLVTLSIVS
ncbi:hypothetical protein B0H14DRAFT_2644743 [Mycena olivaceomarginata]|nr:hypothetical protein B0H14DRAFT_2644743 [Mycena olivaceomarginata]